MYSTLTSHTYCALKVLIVYLKKRKENFTIYYKCNTHFAWHHNKGNHYKLLLHIIYYKNKIIRRCLQYSAPKQTDKIFILIIIICVASIVLNLLLEEIK